MTERLNIPRSVTDPHYRYKMPKLFVKEESRLNGVKTNISNVGDVAAALRVPANVIIKFFCAETGTNQVKDSIIMGSHSQDDLQKRLDKFIVMYVLCKKCKYPELSMEIIKKDVMSTCNACGSKRKLDTTHKAGKQLIKEIPNFYKLNPEFKGKVSNVKLDTTEEIKDKGEKKSKKQKNQEPQEDNVEKMTAKKKVEDIIEKGGEINLLDSRKLELNSDDINEGIAQIDEFITEKPGITCEEIIKKARHIQVGINITADYKYVIVMCGIFNPKRTLINHFEKYQVAFGSLIKADASGMGPQRVLQAMIYMHFHKYPSMKSQFPTGVYKLYEGSFIEGETLTAWHAAPKSYLDKSSCMHDRKTEKEAKVQLDEMIEHIKSCEGEYDEEYDEEAEENKTEEVEKTAAQKQQDLIEAQMAAQQSREEKARTGETEQTQEIDTTEGQTGEAEAKIDITKVEVDEVFDINDI